MEEFIKEHFKGINVTSKIISGYAAQEIINYTHTHNMDLIVMGTHGRTGIDRILFGSVAEKVIKTSDVPVLTVRPTKDTTPTV
jgi:nucleotide-binding universal stress UspA family protein